MVERVTKRAPLETSTKHTGWKSGWILSIISAVNSNSLLALLGLVAGIGFVDDVNAAFPAHYFAVGMARFQRLNGRYDFHVNSLFSLLNLIKRRL